MSAQKKIEVVPYNPNWTKQFEALKAVFEKALEGISVIIEHVGSTAVPGLAAKPIIDLDIIVKDEKSKNQVIEKLAPLGYEHIGDLGIKGREAFKRQPGVPKTTHLSMTPPNEGWQEHHLYVCIDGIDSLRNHLNLRNYLRQHPDKAAAYGQLKMQLAEKFPYDIDAYVEGKSAFIAEILQASGMDTSVVEDITEQNKADNAPR